MLMLMLMFYVCLLCHRRANRWAFLSHKVYHWYIGWYKRGWSPWLLFLGWVYAITWVLYAVFFWFHTYFACKTLTLFVLYTPNYILHRKETNPPKTITLCSDNGSAFKSELFSMHCMEASSLLVFFFFFLNEN